MPSKLWFIITCIIISVIPCAYGNKEYPNIKASIQPEKATVGVPLTYTITISGKNSEQVEITPPEKGLAFPVKKDEKIQSKPIDPKDKSAKKEPKEYVPIFGVYGAKKIDNSTSDMTDIRIIVDITYYWPGKHTLPMLTIKDSKGEKVGYKAPQVEITPVNKDGKMEELEPPFDFGGNYYRLIILIIGVMLLTAAAIGIYLYVKKKREATAKAVVIVPPIEIFLHEVDRFGGRTLIINKQLEEYVFGMSMIFRKFLSAQLNFDASEMTSDEIDRALKKMFTKYRYEKYGSLVVKIFELWDLTKYAEFAPSEEILLSHHEKAITIAQDIARDANYGRI